MKTLYLFLSIVFLVCASLHPAMAQTLVKDINSDTSSTFGENENPEIVAIGANVYFVADDGIKGSEVWTSDGTAAKTKIVKDINSFSTGEGTYGSDPYGLAVFNNVVYFFANDGINGEALWKTNGTEAGTALVYAFGDKGRLAKSPNKKSQKKFKTSCKNKTISPNRSLYKSRSTSHRNPVKGLMAIAGNCLYFVYKNSGNEYELWKTDGTVSGTKNVNTTNSNEIKAIVAMNGFVYFCTKTNLWRSDGSYNGTFTFANFTEIKVDYASKTTLVPIGNILYFVADGDDGKGMELWRTEGNYDTTWRIADIKPDSEGSNISEMIAMGETLYFTADDGGNGQELWKSNGTDQSTTMVADIYNGSTGSTPQYLVAMGSNVYFAANDGTKGIELWKSNGTKEGTELLKDIYTDSGNSRPNWLTVIGSLTYFTADDNVIGTELWKTDGTTAGTAIVANIYGKDSTVINHSYPKYLANCNNTLYFTAFDGSSMTRGVRVGRELWKSKGTEATTLLVADIEQSSTHAFKDNSDDNEIFMTNVGTTFYFVANDGVEGYELWKSTGTAAGTTMVTKRVTDIQFLNMRGTNTLLYFIQKEDDKDNMWRTDGTEAGMHPVGGGIEADQDFMESCGSTLYYQEKVYKTLYETADGSTSLKVNAPSTDEIRNVHECATINNIFFFTAENPNDGNKIKLWRISGSAEKALEITETEGASISDAVSLKPLGMTPYFVRTSKTPRELWKINTTTNKAEKITSVTGDVENIMGYVGTYLFIAIKNGGEYEVWQTTGTVTTRVKSSTNRDMYAFYDSDDENDIVGSTAGSFFFFTSDDDVLWQTNGTKAGTVPVSDSKGRIFTGIYHGWYQGAGSTLYIYYNDGIHGKEWWQTTGTASSTKMLTEMNPNGGAEIYAAQIVSGKLYFVADDFRHGRELWIK